MLDYDKFNNNASLDLVINFAARKKILRSQRFYSIYIYAASLLDDRRRKKERKKKRNWKELADKSDRVGRRMNDVAGGVRETEICDNGRGETERRRRRRVWARWARSTALEKRRNNK